MNPPTMTLTARNPEDVLALVPVVLGFQPEDSLVMLTFGAPGDAESRFHARVTLPKKPEEIDHVVASLTGPAVRHRVRSVLLVAYGNDVSLAESVTGAVRESLRRHRIEVQHRLAADGRRWWSLPVASDRFAERGTAYDVSAHPFMVRSVVQGMVTHRTRADLAATLDSQPIRVQRVQATMVCLDPDRPGTQEAIWALELIAGCLETDRRPGTTDAARLLLALAHPKVREATLLMLTRDSARAMVGFWSDLVRRSPVPALAGPATTTAYAAWLAGDGALAWCALDRAAEADPDDRFAAMLAQGLEAAVPPSAWDTMKPDRALPH